MSGVHNAYTGGPEEFGGTGGTILLVEDDEGVRTALAMSLRREHYDVVPAKAIDEALPAFDANPIDVVVTDLLMPGGSGIDLMRKLAEKDRNVPVIIITANQSIEAAAEAVRKQAFDYLTKPVPLRVLRDTVAEAIKKRRTTRHRQYEQQRLVEENRQLSLRHQRTTALLSVLFSNAVEGILVLDSAGRLSDASDSFVRLIGKELTELFEVNASELFDRHPTEGDIQDLVVRLAQAPPTEGHWRGEVTVRAVNGNRLPARLSLNVCERPVRHGEESARYVMALLYYESGYEELSRQLQQADRLATIGLLAGSAAHEIKNELGPLIGYLSMIQQGGAKPVDLNMINIMRDSVRRVHEHVEQILEPLRPRVRTRGAVVLSERVDSILVLLKRAGRLRRMNLAVEGPKDDVVVHADKDEMHQVALNLITNAIDALGDGDGGVRGSIWIRTSYEGRFGVLEVEDTGSGIPDHVRARVFEPFFTTKGAGGTGLGLPVVNDIVRTLRGRVELARGAHGGTIARAWVPRYQPQFETTPVGPTPRALPSKVPTADSR